MAEYTHLGFDHGTTVDPEPSRCRRTDGKKWRCSKNTVLKQKYCERHMHRGRNRSRKPVEKSQVNSLLATKPYDKSFTIPTPNTKSQVSNPNPLVTIVAPISTTFDGVATGTSDNRSHDNVCEKDDQTKRFINNMSVKSGAKGSILCDGSNGISNGMGFSPKSVLQVSGCNQSYLNDRNNTEEPEPGRCRRTDGKKWRCKCVVLPGQKYCATHMHRGSKKRLTNHKITTRAITTPTTTCSSAVTIARLPYTSATTDLQNACCRIPKTKIFMSVSASDAPVVECNEKSGNCSDTDTSKTITDTMNEHSYVSF